MFVMITTYYYQFFTYKFTLLFNLFSLIRGSLVETLTANCFYFRYILPNHMLLLIAEKLPKEMQGVLACCNPIPPLVRQNLVLIHQIILKAREQPLVVRVRFIKQIRHYSKLFISTLIYSEQVWYQFTGSFTLIY